MNHDRAKNDDDNDSDDGVETKTQGKMDRHLGCNSVKK